MTQDELNRIQQEDFNTSMEIQSALGTPHERALIHSVKSSVLTVIRIQEDELIERFKSNLKGEFGE